MSNRELKRQLIKEAERKPQIFYSFCVSFISLFFGAFTIYYDGYLIANVEPYFARLPEDIIGALLIIWAVIKILGVITNRTLLKRVGILGLSALWTGLLVLAITYSFGTGYPNPSYMYTALVAAICYRISYRGDF